MLGGAMLGSAHAAGWKLPAEPVKIALIGCGSRGAGAVANALCNSSMKVLHMRLAAIVQAWFEPLATYTADKP
mgnify:CR=1 FL=1